MEVLRDTSSGHRQRPSGERSYGRLFYLGSTSPRWPSERWETTGTAIRISNKNLSPRLSNSSEETYADQIELASGDKVVYLNERTEKDYAEVDTKVISSKGEETLMTYKLHPVDSDWKVFDIVVENISIVNNYRSQFNRVLSNASLDELIKG